MFFEFEHSSLLFRRVGDEEKNGFPMATISGGRRTFISIISLTVLKWIPTGW
jgi:hypothetical protein